MSESLTVILFLLSGHCPHPTLRCLTQTLYCADRCRPTVNSVLLVTLVVYSYGSIVKVKSSVFMQWSVTSGSGCVYSETLALSSKPHSHPLRVILAYMCTPNQVRPPSASPLCSAACSRIRLTKLCCSLSHHTGHGARVVSSETLLSTLQPSLYAINIVLSPAIKCSHLLPSRGTGTGAGTHTGIFLKNILAHFLKNFEALILILIFNHLNNNYNNHIL